MCMIGEKYKHKYFEAMKGKKEFTEQEIMELRMLIRERVKASRSDQKRIRNAMRSIGFYGRDDWGIVDCQ